MESSRVEAAPWSSSTSPERKRRDNDQDLQRQPHSPVVSETITTWSEYERIALVPDGGEKRARRADGYGHEERIRRRVEMVSQRDRDWRHDNGSRGIVDDV